MRAVLGELQVQHAIVAQEMPIRSPELYAALRHLLGNIPVELVPHGELKVRTATASGVVRTGEFTPYANVILVSGVVF